MNRDREALSKKLLATRDRYLIAQPDKPDSAWAVLTECAEALALPPAGGVEESDERVCRALDAYFGNEWHLYTAPDRAMCRTLMARAINAALSPRSPDTQGEES